MKENEETDCGVHFTTDLLPIWREPRLQFYIIYVIIKW